ncbi:lytic polysaccharide monooxygenase [Streptomyces synnematoformans]|uniref:Lytic polysaccharide monooxygenase n=1 Tax=Streptomyces synnematoformans TaxID=415721 RepID=A0ABN2Y2E0_9ACTN
MRKSSPSARRPRSAFRRLAEALALLIAVTASALLWTSPAQAHGTVVDPATRAYHCWEEWGDDHLNPAMEQEDPMCWQAWRANPNTMWNWMSMLQDGLGGQFEARIPNGKLCSNNHPNFESLNNPGPWKTTDVGDNFSIHLYDQASHGADFFRVYVSKQGFDPKTQSLGWGDLDFITETGSYPPANDITFPVQTSGYSGHHIVFTIWQASHLDQAYLMCSDVNFG